MGGFDSAPVSIDFSHDSGPANVLEITHWLRSPDEAQRNPGRRRWRPESRITLRSIRATHANTGVVINSPLPRRRQRAVIASQIPQSRIQENHAVEVRESGHARDHREHGETRGIARARLVIAAGAIRSRRSGVVQDRYVLAVFRSPAP